MILEAAVFFFEINQFIVRPSSVVRYFPTVC